MINFNSAVQHTELKFSRMALDACEICRPFWLQVSEDDQTRLREFDAVWTSRPAAGGAKSRTPGQKLDEFDGLVTMGAVMLLEEPSLKAIGSDLMVSISFESGFTEEIHFDHKNVSGTYVVQRGDYKDAGKMMPFSSNSTDSEEAWSKATSWMQACLSTHTACNVELKAEPWYPTRLLDLNAGCGGIDIVRLVITAEHPPSHNDRYATLSHCWGSAQFLQLKKVACEDFQRGIELSKLPKTFREAIKVTRRLGVRYLWIDSLCIFQDRDDLSDWLVEAGLMHKVYLNSFCNISAAGARDSSKGLFFERDPRVSLNVDMCLNTEGFGLGTEYIDCSIVDLSFWDHGVGQCRLNKRGWVLQERLLSPRVLHFGSDQLFWECREQAAAECYPERMPEILENGVPMKFKRLSKVVYGPDAMSQEREPDDPTFYYRIWDRIARAYGSTSLTVASDKLLALSGIAQHFETLIDDTYVVGMWRKHLARNLLWHVDKETQIDGSPSARPEVYRAPSFSWASVDGKIATGPLDQSKLLIDVEGVHIEYVSENTSGCCVLPFEMVMRTIGQHQFLYLKVNGAIVIASSKDESNKCFDHENTTGSLYYVVAQDQEKLDGFVRCLILMAVDEERKTFKRIGLAVTNEAEEIEMLQSATHVADETPSNNSDLHGTRTIRII
ncbi:heterokaryon incompatibility protein [Colletotrichum phormii]|uniref:Heterokaryon incompatibility protein n=1 Tax=Colletotrichum phormii TaxID=359342 RepID=A0AAJ0EDD5_9PEZI|nr:heterokaryon incompatibility protein [Colletotrichum phormii]KAK1634598.1 heterokaryon incompatibility protein [Colletotrichum phormii]